MESLNRALAPHVIALVLLVAASGAAVDGVVEINQAKALAGGVTPGDTLGGFPVIISVPGSYRLTGDLDLTDASVSVNLSAIEVETSHVTIDLNGFSIRGKAVCSGTPVTSCSNTGSGEGITNGGVGGRGYIRVRNGTIVGMPNQGISLNGSGSIVEDVSLVSNGGDGAFLNTGSVVARCLAIQNGGDGIISPGVLQSEARGNFGDGIQIVETGDLVLESRASSNGGFGLNPGGGVIGYGQNVFTCNNSSGSCTDGVQVNGAGAIQIGTNVCGSNAACP